MAKNDVVLLDGIIDQRLIENIPSSERDEVFEFFCLEQLLKDYDLSHDELESGWIDGRGDGGFDGVYIFINGLLLEDVADFVWPRSSASIDIWLVTCKHHAAFVQATLDAMLATIQEVFDLSRHVSDLHGSYSEELLEFRSLLEATLKKLSIGRPTLRFHLAYASRGDAGDLGREVAARGNQIESEFSKLFSSCVARFSFCGATEMLDLYRKSKSFSLELPFQEHLATGKDSYVLLVRLEDYWNFVSDESGDLRRYLFDSNVRDYLGITGVNDDIANSLADPNAPDFWWLNNGITVLATNATIPGKTIQLQDIQIVNGLQTTETIFRHFQKGDTTSKDRAVLVKIIVSSDAVVRDRIIRATNNQSPVEIAALHATDKIQRDIEDILERHNWYYERRKNYYRNIGKPQSRFVTPMLLASACVALILKNVSQATRLRTRFMRSQQSYDTVFSERLPIEIWPILANVYKSVDLGLNSVPTVKRRGERFVNTWRPLVSLLAVSKKMRTFAYSPSKLVGIENGGEITPAEVEEIWDLITRVDSEFDQRKKKIKPLLVKACCEEAAKAFSLSGIQALGRQYISMKPAYAPPAYEVSEDLLNEVDAVLPQQPWKPRVHIDVANKLGRKPGEVSTAIQLLIKDGRRHPQRDGVVYDAFDNIIAVDPERVAPLDD
jgi:hypothetical protein